MAGLDTYLDYFASTTGVLLDSGDPLLRKYLAHDLASDGTVRLSPDALLDDAADLFFEPNPFDRIDVPVRLSHAQWGAGPEAAPFYTRDEVGRVGRRTWPTSAICPATTTRERS